MGGWGLPAILTPRAARRNGATGSLRINFTWLKVSHHKTANGGSMSCQLLPAHAER